MNQETFNLVIGIATFVGMVAFIIFTYLQNKQIQALIVALQTVNSNPATIAAIKGATEGIPQDVFAKTLIALTAVKSFVPTPELKALLDQWTTFIERVDNDVTNDPPPDARTPFTGSGGANLAPTTPPAAGASIGGATSAGGLGVSAG